MAKQRLHLFHPDSPGVRVWVERGWWGRLFKPAAFATLGECLRDVRVEGRVSG